MARAAPQAGSTSTRWSSRKRVQASTADWSLTTTHSTGRIWLISKARLQTFRAPSEVATPLIEGSSTSSPALTEAR
ncbi:hypothetical protein D9M70_604450 [compost metagenome]